MTTKKSTNKAKPSLLLLLLARQTGPLTFGMFLRSARTSMDLTQAAMARKLGISRGTLCDIEKGRQLVSPTLALKIAKIAGMSTTVAVKACLQDQLNKAKIKLTVDLSA